MPLLEARALHCGYGADEIVHGVDLTVDPGEIVALLGPNGCGKTTFVKGILGYVKVSRGQILLDGAELRAQTASARARLGIGYVPQLQNVFKPLTVEENLEIGGYGLRLPERRAAIQQVFELFPRLRERRRQRAGTLSGGERQLLAMGRALVPRPRLLFLDEPSAGLAPARADEAFGHVRAIAATGVAVVLVEQDVHRALAVAVRAYVLVAGRTALAGLAQEVAADEGIRTAYLGARPAAPPPA
jgi:ABC-type branched-subunit amino acid transport system ATPase component